MFTGYVRVILGNKWLPELDGSMFGEVTIIALPTICN